jgi:methionyl aminopeptidase
MAIRYKTPQQVEQMRAAGRIVRRVLDELGSMLAPGVTTRELDAAAERMTLAAGAQCLFKGVPGRGSAPPFPGAICASINEELVHGIPSDRAIRDGDVVSVDFGVRLDGWCADAAQTFIVGDVPADVRRLVDVTRRTLAIAVEMVRPGEYWSRIARRMQDNVEREGFSVVRDLVGHGIGAEMWEDPKVPNFVSNELLQRDILLKEGMVIAVEPMVNMGTAQVTYATDGWTIVTRDAKPAAHFEHTLAIVAGGVDVLTDGR